MIYSLFGNVANVSEYYPTAFWNIDEEKPFESSKLRQDTIWKGKDIAVIIDSKYSNRILKCSFSFFHNIHLFHFIRLIFIFSGNLKTLIL